MKKMFLSVCFVAVMGMNQLAAFESESMVNTYYKGQQRHPAIATNGATRFVVWYSIGQDGDASGVYGQIIDADDAAQHTQFRLNTTTAGNQTEPDVACNGDIYLAAWQSEYSGRGYDIVARLFDHNGDPLSGEIIVNTTTAGAQKNVAVIACGANFFVTWENWLDNQSQCSIYAQYLSATGEKIGSEIVVSSATGTKMLRPHLASCSNTVLVAWYESNGSIHAQIYDNEGTPVGDPLGGGGTPEAQYGIPVVTANYGNYFICFSMRSNSNHLNKYVYGQWISPQGEVLSDAIQITADPIVSVDYPTMDIAASGSDMLLAWHISNDYEADIFAQMIGSTGIPTGDRILLNARTNSHEYCPDVVYVSGMYTVVWDSLNFGGDLNIYMQNIHRVLQRSEQEIPVNTTTAGHQRSPAVAGNQQAYLALYEDVSYDETQADIYAQLFDAQHNKIGAEHRVNAHTNLNQCDPALATDGTQYLAVWASYEQDSDEYGIFARLVDNDGTPLGLEIEVNSISSGRQCNPAVIFNGVQYLVVWENYANSSAYSDIYGQYIATDGSAVGSEFIINTATYRQQSEPALAQCSDRTLVVWQSSKTSITQFGIYGRLIDQSGSFVSNEFLIRDTGGYAINPSAAANANSFVVTWQDYDDNAEPCPSYCVKAQMVTYYGSRFGSVQDISQHESMNHVDPQIASDGNDFIVVWASYDNDSVGYDVYGRYLTAVLTEITEFKLNTTLVEWQHKPVLSITGARTDILWQSYAQDGSGLGIYSSSIQVELVIENDYAFFIPESALDDVADLNTEFLFADFDDDGYFDFRFIEILDDGSEGRTFLYWGEESDPYSTYTILNTEKEVIEDTSTHYFNSYSSSGLVSYYGLYRDSNRGSNGFIMIMPIYDRVANPTPVSVSISTISGVMLSGNGTLIKSEFRLDTGSEEADATHSAGVSNGATYLLAWADSDTASTGIFARMYTADGSELGDGENDEYRINQHTSGVQSKPTLATNGKDYIVAWESAGQDGDGNGLYARLVGADSTYINSEFRITSYTTGSQSDVSIASNGVRYCAVWQSGHSGQTKIYARLFDAAGTAAAVDYAIAPESAAGQSAPVVVCDGINFMTAWREGSALFVRYIGFDGAFLSDPIKITDTADAHSLATDGVTYFVVWQAEGDIYGQIITAEGASIGAVQRLNELTLNDQTAPVAASNGTTYCITWTSDGIDMNGRGIAGRFYYPNGTALSAEQRFNSYIKSEQYEPWVVSDSRNYFVSWTSIRTFGGETTYSPWLEEEEYWNSDNDCDGYSNYDEWGWGTDINDPNDHFDWSVKRVKDEQGKPQVQVDFETKDDIDYDIMYTDSLSDASWRKIGETVEGVGGAVSLSITQLPSYIGLAQDTNDTPEPVNPDFGFFRITIKSSN